ncbi:MAG: NADH-quinone oxidoreductase subunit B family protein [Ktedonobacterales bacterium]
MSANTTRPRRQAAVWVLPVTTGGCGACHQSITALLAGRYAPKLSAQGINFARSPRHADILLITGPLTAAARAEARAFVEAAPQPRALVAVGNCAIDGCVFRGSPHLVASTAEELDVNVEIAGCPPAPAAILAAIAEASELIATAAAVDTTATEKDEDQEADA